MTSCLLVLNSLLFGLGSWVAITGLWLEVPVLIHYLPESWSLGSYLTFSIQLANIVPLIYWYLNFRFPKYWNEISATNLQIFIGIISSIILIFYWRTQIYLFNGQHSIVLFICAFLLSIVDCLSSVTFLPFMARFDSIYLTPYLIGEGLSGFLPMILAMIQNVDENYNGLKVDLNLTENLLDTSENNSTKPILGQLRFEPQTFFVSLLVTLVISWIAFFYLQFNQPTKPEPTSFFNKYIVGIITQQSNETDIKLKKLSKKSQTKQLIADHSENGILPSYQNRRIKKYDKFEYYYHQFLILYACTITFGLLPPLQTYSCLNISQSTLKYATLLSGLSYPVGCSIALFVKCKSIKILTFLSLIATFICGFIFWTALHSPNLPQILRSTFTNQTSVDLKADLTVLSWFMISCWIMFNLILSYVKTMVTVKLNDELGEQALFYVGLFSQFGSLFGSIFMILAVNYFKWFNEK